MVAIAVIFLALGLDTTAVALGLGLSGLKRSLWLRVGITFAVFEGGMPALGLFVGHHLTGVLGVYTGYLAGAILILLGGLGIREALAEDRDDEDKDGDIDDGETAAHRFEGRALLLTGLSVSLDELAIGFSLGMLRVPIAAALAYIGVQAFGLTFLGLSLGRLWGERLGERAELAAGIMLTLIGAALIADRAAGLHWM